MSPQDNDFLSEPIPLDSDDKPKKSGSGQLGKLQPIPMSDSGDGGDGGSEVTGTGKIQTFASTSKLDSAQQMDFKREMNAPGTGATRVRTFHAKLSDGAFSFLDLQINEWIDQNPGVEVKFCSTTIGTVEGKRPEPNIIINVWY